MLIENLLDIRTLQDEKEKSLTKNEWKESKLKKILGQDSWKKKSLKESKKT